MYIFAFVNANNNFSEAVGYDQMKEVEWRKTAFATDASVVNELVAQNKGLLLTDEMIASCPKKVEFLYRTLKLEKKTTKVYRLHLTEEEVKKHNENFNSLQKKAIV